MTRPRVPLLGSLATVPSRGGAALGTVVAAARGVRRSLGARPDLDFSDSPQWRGGTFHNRLPAPVVEQGARASIAAEFVTKRGRGKPRGPVRTERPELPTRAAGLAVTWLGHATVLLEVDGVWVLADPVWSERVSPSATVGPRRSHPVPMALDELPDLDVVLISHDHYDHLDVATIDALARRDRPPAFVVPLGIGAHLRRWGVPDELVVELDWDESHEVGGLTLTCTEARHFSGRGFVNNLTLWSSWTLAGARHRVFFGGDSGYTPAFAEIGQRHGPFDLTILPIGAYDARWPEVHMNPAEAVRAHRDLRGATLLPIHWATFDLAFHDWSEPVEWLCRAAEEEQVTLALPAPGLRVEPQRGLPADTWWRASA